jgi:uncharacterized protein (DUF1697 family)
MQTFSYIAFLRGINVGGHTVKMEYLRQLFTELGFTHVRTYIQTGNVFFESSQTDILSLQQKIEEHLQAALGYAVPVFIYTTDELEHIIANAPFDTIPLTDETRHMVVYVSESLPKDTDLPLLSPKGDYEIVGIGERVIYVVIHLLNGRFESSYFLEKTFKVATTGRFYHTSQKILQVAKTTIE